MPTYTYYCTSCSKKFELFSSIKEYKEHPKCITCNTTNTQRAYEDDMLTISNMIRKSDSELKTIGDLANRNRDKMSNDHKSYLQEKHNEYKDTELAKELPKGMSKIKKPTKKIKWT